MIETLSWEEISVDPDKQLQLLEEKESELQRELFSVRHEMRAMRALQKVRQLHEEWSRSGIPGLRRAENDADRESAENATTGFQPPTRKARILALLSQDPQRHWKVHDVASALDEVPKIKSVRVAMDELAKSGSLTKLPNAFYQFGQSQQA